MSLYLQNTIKLVMKNTDTEICSLHFCQLNEGSRELTNQIILILLHYIPTFLEIEFNFLIFFNNIYGSSIHT